MVSTAGDGWLHQGPSGLSGNGGGGQGSGKAAGYESAAIHGSMS
jgi:hypothetical protein